VAEGLLRPFNSRGFIAAWLFGGRRRYLSGAHTHAGVSSRPDPSSALAAGQFYIRLPGDQAAPQIVEEEGQFGQDPPLIGN